MTPARLRDLASFAVAFNYTPADYWGMTLAEHDAIVREYRRRNR